MEFVPTRYRYHFSKEEIDGFNQTCDCFVIPLADAFRKDFVPELKGLTALVRALQIPCYVIGVGVRAPIGEKDFDFSYNDEVREFVAAVLEKSSIVGLRGQITADYLKKLGFTPEKDFTVIGCPSMYARAQLKVRNLEITSASDVAYNLSPGADPVVMQYIRRNAKTFHSAVYIPQNVEDLKLLYVGIRRKAREDFPKELDDPMMENTAFPGSVEAWRRVLETKQLSFGTRLHGNIMGVLSGIPTIHIPFDARTEELVEYHALACAKRKDIEDDVPVLQLAERLDFQQPVRAQKRNFEHYLDFLDANGISHIDPKCEEAPLDRLIQETTFLEPLQSIRCAEREEMLDRTVTYSNYADQKMKSLKDEKEKQTGSLKKEKKKVSAQARELEEKSGEIQRLKEENEALKQEGPLDAWKRKRGKGVRLK